MQDEKSLSERRLSERLSTIVPIELRVLDKPGGATLHGPMHALVTDASLGGLRVELLGPAAAAFANRSSHPTVVTLTFLLRSLHALGSIEASVRWVTQQDEGRCIGLELIGERMQLRVLRVLESTSLPAMARRSGMQAGALAAIVLCLVGLGVFAANSWQAQQDLRLQLSQMSESLVKVREQSSVLDQQVKNGQAQAARLREQLLACAEDDEPQDGEEEQEEAADKTE